MLNMPHNILGQYSHNGGRKNGDKIFVFISGYNDLLETHLVHSKNNCPSRN